VIVFPGGWGVISELDSIGFVHPHGRDAAVLEYRERVRPLVKLGSLVRRFLAERPTLRCDALPDCGDRLTTAEGEYAAQVTLACVDDGRPAQCNLGIVFGDDFYARLAAICYRVELYEEVTRVVRELVVGDTHQLGMRRRRFEYSPPRGWQPIVHGFVTDWFAPNYPRDAVQLTVYPANLLATMSARPLVRLLIGEGPARVEREAIVPLSLSTGLVGELAAVALALGERRRFKLCAVLHDSRFSYALAATALEEGQLAAHRTELERVIDSVQPIPNPLDRVRDDYVAQSYWTE
jgi:hypothetical protein